MAPIATVNMAKVMAAISHPELQSALFLDEADKWGKTEMVKNYLTNFVDDMTTQQAQVVLSSQVDLSTLISMIGTTYGTPSCAVRSASGWHLHQSPNRDRGGQPTSKPCARPPTGVGSWSMFRRNP